MEEDEELLRLLAGEAFDILLWSRRMGLKKDRQIEEIVAAFRVRLRERRIGRPD